MDRPTRTTRDAADTHEDVALADTLRELMDELPGLIGDRLRLLALELRAARTALVGLVAMAAVALLLWLGAWLLLCMALVAWLVQQGASWPVAVLTVALANVSGAVFASWMAIARLPRLTLPGTMRHLTLAGRPPPEVSDPPQRAP